MENSFGLDDTSMLTNVGSITEEGPHLSDCEDLSIQEQHKEQNDNVTTSDVSSASYEQLSVCASTSPCVGEVSSSEDGAEKDGTAETLPSSANNTTDSPENHDTVMQGQSSHKIEENHPIQCDTTSDSTSPQEPNNANSSAPDSKSTCTSSIYMDNGTSKTHKPICKDKKPHRMTMAERATQEALALFGGCDYSSIPMRKIDLHMELEAEKEKKKRELEQDGESQPPIKRPKTRLQTAREESQEVFRDISLASGRKKYSRVQRMKAESSRTSQDSKVTVRSTRAQRAREEALEAFGGAELDKIPKKKKKTIPQPEGKPETTVAQTGKRLTRVERARLEALQAFGGSGLQDVMCTAKRRIARTLEEKEAKMESENGEGESIDKENMEDSSEVMVAVADSE